MKLQKLVYYAHGWSLGLRGEPLIDEQVEAWQFGPVIASLYHDLKRFGADAISPGTRFSAQAIFSDGDWTPDFPDFESRLIEKVWQTYSKYSAIELSQMTHEPGTPWHEIDRQGGTKIKGTDIPTKMIQDYFAKKVRGA